MEMCSKFKHLFGNDDSRNIYQYLSGFGMYRPNRQSYFFYEEMKNQNIWDKVAKYFHFYRKKWGGPNIPVYLFPLSSVGGFRRREEVAVKSGVSFKDKMFLFIGPVNDEKEIEALFVHEYHHVCRMNRQDKSLKDYTLLDSIVMEGLAENAVKEFCGEQYVAKWSTHYSAEDLEKNWTRHIKENLQCKKHNKIHDEILFGHKGYPPMIGYALGYERVSQYRKKHKISIEESFRIPAEKLINIE
ncbi:hypothetical protein GNT69_18430 [Bacillus sp. B15-48]|nr:hypothetical protein [Bacillus sp. B15-48]